MKTLLAALLVLGLHVPPLFGTPFTTGHHYGSHFSKTYDPLGIQPPPTRWRLFRYDEDGTIISGDILTALDDSQETRGIAFGPDNLLYVVTLASKGYRVLAMNQLGTIQKTYVQEDARIGGNISFGKIIFQADGRFYVGDLDGLTRFQIGDPSSKTRIWNSAGVYGMTRIPNGNLVLASSNEELVEIREDGTRVRSIELSDPDKLATGLLGLSALRDVLYHPQEKALYVTHLGHSTFEWKIMKMDPQSGALRAIDQYWYADDLALLKDGSLLVGSRTKAPARYSTDLELLSEFEGEQFDDARLFVATFPPIFEVDLLPTLTPELSISLGKGTVSLSWTSQSDHNYFLETSSDLVSWSSVSEPTPGTGDPMTLEVFREEQTRYYRVQASRN